MLGVSFRQFQLLLKVSIVQRNAKISIVMSGHHTHVPVRGFVETGSHDPCARRFVETGLDDSDA